MGRNATRMVLFASLASLAQPALTAPFEWWGYQQGMSIEMAQSVAQRNGHTFQLTDRFLANLMQGKEYVEHLQFCKRGLYFASYLVDGGLRKYIKVLSSLEREGFKRVDTTWDDRLSGSREKWDLYVYFAKPGSENQYYIEARLGGSEQRDITNTQVSYMARDGFCNQH
jgi:hypothetical protein